MPPSAQMRISSGRSSAAWGAVAMTRLPATGLPNVTSVVGRRASPAARASAAQVDNEDLHPTVATRSTRRGAVSPTGRGLPLVAMDCAEGSMDVTVRTPDRGREVDRWALPLTRSATALPAKPDTPGATTSTAKGGTSDAGSTARKNDRCRTGHRTSTRNRATTPEHLDAGVSRWSTDRLVRRRLDGCFVLARRVEEPVDER